jgi:hypothetical protein
MQKKKMEVHKLRSHGDIILSVQTEAVKIPLASTVSLAAHFTFLMWDSLWKTAETLEKLMSYSVSVFLFVNFELSLVTTSYE